MTATSYSLTPDSASIRPEPQDFEGTVSCAPERACAISTNGFESRMCRFHRELFDERCQPDLRM